jgi:hypothetical protein
VTLVAPGEWALVTGASSGIGARIATRLLERGIPTLLVARTAAPMEALAARFAGRVPCEVLPADLSREGAAADLLSRSEGAGKPVGLLVNDAGFGWNGAFDAQPAELLAAMLAVNVVAPAALTRAFLPAMRARRRAGSSTSRPRRRSSEPVLRGLQRFKAFLSPFSRASREVARTASSSPVSARSHADAVLRARRMDEKKLRAFGLLDPDTVAERGSAPSRRARPFHHVVEGSDLDRAPAAGARGCRRRSRRRSSRARASGARQSGRTARRPYGPPALTGW